MLPDPGHSQPASPFPRQSLSGWKEESADVATLFFPANFLEPATPETFLELDPAGFFSNSNSSSSSSSGATKGSCTAASRRTPPLSSASTAGPSSSRRASRAPTRSRGRTWSSGWATRRPARWCARARSALGAPCVAAAGTATRRIRNNNNNNNSSSNNGECRRECQ